jgi:hypothetical protein
MHQFDAARPAPPPATGHLTVFRECKAVRLRAENRNIARLTPIALYQQQYNLHIGAVDYERSHKSAIRREVQIRKDLSTINGGFAGGLLKQN